MASKICFDAQEKPLARFPFIFPMFYCISPPVESQGGACYLWGCVLSIFLTIVGVVTMIALLMLCRAHIIVDGSRTTRLIFFFTTLSCLLFIVERVLYGDPRIFAGVELLEGMVSITVSFVLASIWSRVTGRPEYIKRFVMPFFSLFVTSICVVFLLGVLGVFHHTTQDTPPRHQKNGTNATKVIIPGTSMAVVLDCYDDTWVLFSILESVVVTMSLVSAAGITKKLKEMTLSETYRRRKMKEIWGVAVIYSLSVYVTLICSIFEQGKKSPEGNNCAHWSSELLEADTVADALPKLLGSATLFILDTFVPMWSVVLLIRYLFPMQEKSRRTSSWSGDEYVGRDHLMASFDEQSDQQEVGSDRSTFGADDLLPGGNLPTFGGGVN
jgi:hypothetical protein